MSTQHVSTTTPTFTAAELAGRMLHRRAVEAVIWGMPAVNYDPMLQETLTKTAGKVNHMIYWGRPLDWHNQTLTPDPDTLYFMAFFNTKEVGPMVIDAPGGRNLAGGRGHRRLVDATSDEADTINRKLSETTEYSL
jgi:hypothetical protein